MTTLSDKMNSIDLSDIYGQDSENKKEWYESILKDNIWTSSMASELSD